jgi:hypothetical protein
MEVTIENIVSFTTTNNLVVNQLMEHKAAVVVAAKAMFVEEPKWTMVMAKNVHQVVSRIAKTMADVPK